MNITQTTLRQMAYGASFSKGEDYFLRGLVKEIGGLRAQILTTYNDNIWLRISS